DGGPHTPIAAGQTWSPSFTVLDHAATYWYHPHLHEHTEEQVTRGAAGFIIVEDPIESKLALPRTYGVDDFPIVIQSRAFDPNKQFLTGTAADNVILTNATLNAYLDVPAQVVRLRFLNGSTERVYNLGFSDGRGFYQITTDGGLLDAPVQLTRLRMAPGERAEILVNLSGQEGQAVRLMSFASELPSGIYGAANPSAMPMGSIAGYANNPLNGNNFDILRLNIVTQTANPVTAIPATLAANTPYSETNTQADRNLTFQPAQMGPTGMLNGPFVINGAGFDMDVINYTIPLGNTEVWTLTNMTAISHPFHIHDVQFYILDINGAAPPSNMQGRKDVVLVPPMGGTVRFITRFDDFANKDVPYMYHCHMLSHEDDGMMGQFIVLDNTTITAESANNIFAVFPNPTLDAIIFNSPEPVTCTIFSTSGQLLERLNLTEGMHDFSMAGYPAGVYYFHIIGIKNNSFYKVIKL
ncbi:MAG: multicopper oxidase domain-containing protein, partial [Saprospiraceae bacterium]|nr:multicopper oxidase domain-containing protein [Saprospiraceae bacterium]